MPRPAKVPASSGSRYVTGHAMWNLGFGKLELIEESLSPDLLQGPVTRHCFGCAESQRRAIWDRSSRWSAMPTPTS